MHFFIIITANMLMFINARFCGEWCIGVSNILFLIQEFVCERPDGQVEMMPVSQQLLFHLKETLHKNTLMANCDISFLLLLLILFLRFGLPLLYPRITMMSTLILLCVWCTVVPQCQSLSFHLRLSGRHVSGREQICLVSWIWNCIGRCNNIFVGNDMKPRFARIPSHLYFKI